MVYQLTPCRSTSCRLQVPCLWLSPCVYLWNIVCIGGSAVCVNAVSKELWKEHQKLWEEKERGMLHPITIQPAWKMLWAIIQAVHVYIIDVDYCLKAGGKFCSNIIFTWILHADNKKLFTLQAEVLLITWCQHFESWVIKKPLLAG